MKIIYAYFGLWRYSFIHRVDSVESMHVYIFYCKYKIATAYDTMVLTESLVCISINCDTP